APLHRVADDDVETAEVGDELQNRTRLEVLEVQREALAAVFAILVEAARARGLLLRGRRLELEGELVVGLIRDLVVRGCRRDDEPRIVIGARRVDGENGRREILDVQPAQQLLRQRGVLEVDDDAAAFLADVHRRARIVELDDDLAGAVGAAAEIDVTDRAIARRGSGRARGGAAALSWLRSNGRRAAGPLAEQHDDVVAFNARLIRNHRAQVQHDARTAVRFGGENRRERADVRVLATRLEGERRVRQVERDARG